ncbi:MAG: UDP-N-acetylglucosamine 1-carboxyvinyltransferase [Defluviitaleaceae bacterium]|nr:UDP-N-acetylglucosamine 1-carboxyvinyltransferase [Defluviitaleaceae bacterium]
MDSLVIRGGRKIKGEIDIQGSKNSALPILCSCILVKGIVVLHNVPNITDIHITIEILKSLGAIVKIENNNTIIIDSTNINSSVVPYSLAHKMRSSIIFLGSLLGRMGEVTIGYPGGCKLGARPIDLHLKSLISLGVNITEDEEGIKCVCNNLFGNKINLSFKSVGATQNIILAAVCAKGATIIKNAATEPEILDMIAMLNKCGSKIKVIGDTIIIDGVKKLNGTEYTVMSDRIVAGTYLATAAITNGEIYLKGVKTKQIYPITKIFEDMGMDIRTYDNFVFAKTNRLKAVNITTSPHPGFPTDMQAQMMPVLSLSKGISSIEETIFESRDKHISELNKMGANITIMENYKENKKTTFIINEINNFTGNVVYAKDLRGGAALVIAGLCAEGITIVEGYEYIKRGYQNIIKDLKSLGADISNNINISNVISEKSHILA